MKTESETPALKLFVVGESSGDPSKWKVRPSGRLLVIAKDAASAVSVADRDPRTQVALVDMTCEAILSEECYSGA